MKYIQSGAPIKWQTNFCRLEVGSPINLAKLKHLFIFLFSTEWLSFDCYVEPQPRAVELFLKSDCFILLSHCQINFAVVQSGGSDN